MLDVAASLAATYPLVRPPANASAGLVHQPRSGGVAGAIQAAGWWLAHVHVDDSNPLQPGTGHVKLVSIGERPRDFVPSDRDHELEHGTNRHADAYRGGPSPGRS